MITRTLVWTLRIAAALVAVSTALLGCSSTVTSGNGGMGGTGGAQATAEDLFKCNLGTDCPQMYLHIDLPDGTCAGELVASGKPGVLLALLDPGPYLDQTQSLILLRGDGTAVLQNRERHCGPYAPPCPTPWNTAPWETPTVQQQCDVVIPSECAAGGAGGFGGGPEISCSWLPWGNLADCTTIDELSCSDAQAILMQ